MRLDEKELSAIITMVIEELQQREKNNKTSGNGIFHDINDAIDAASKAQQELIELPIKKRNEIIDSMRKVILDNLELLSRMAVEETKMGRVDDKIKKNELVAVKTPGTEILETEALTGDHGLTLVEMAPFGVIGSLTPSTNPSETIINNAIGMIAAGNSVVFGPHPSAKRVSHKTVELLNAAIMEAGGPQNLITTVYEPTLDTARALIDHPGINILVATGGKAVVKAVLSSGKKAIGAGAGNPPVVVDETADVRKAARDIVIGSSFDNNLPCISEKEVIAVKAIYDKLIEFMQEEGAYRIKGDAVKALEELVLTQKDEYKARSCTTGEKLPPSAYGPNKNFIGKDALVILKELGISAGKDVKVIIVETDKNHPFVFNEMLMPVLPIVKVDDVDEGIKTAVEVEHGNRHTAVMHSKNVDNMTRFARAIKTTIFVKNAPSYAGIGVGGEGFTSFTIAGPTGEGLTSAKNFVRIRRCVLANALSIL
ncbi:Succinate-semialdehyde dehydrogenase (acetylating) [Koleobacter methoxysyntrophicus]|uniref:Succinate-semialdehyde dehydrogenase (Acetylating) n=1 Tax=Koleobacter methoxysyntrophicus TaxID=2751313 RepID=A0A8A0RIV1_9FIRM|nr:Succinate-semialdehyde dehydrogenase (acetylating) [Koleobacter methoxysyntrophicus]